MGEVSKEEKIIEIAIRIDSKFLVRVKGILSLFNQLATAI
jgi:hypothetical protein